MHLSTATMLASSLLPFLPAAQGLPQNPIAIPGSSSATYPPTIRTVDVAIVGGGLSGLSAAKDLAAGGASFLVLEARDRVGGRTWNKPVPNGIKFADGTPAVTGAGAEFVGPTQDRVLQLAAELGLQVFKTWDDGDDIMVVANPPTNSTSSSGNSTGRTTARYSNKPDGPTGGLPPVGDAALQQIGQAIFALDSMAAELDVLAPWTHPKAAEWDAATLSTWLDGAVSEPGARTLFDVATGAIFSTAPREMSLLYTLAYIASAGNATTKGTLERLLGTADGAQESRVVGGTQRIALTLATKLGAANIALSAPVRRIEKQTTSNSSSTTSDHGYTVYADGGLTVRAKRVVVAMSPPLAGRISYAPPLPAARDQLTQRMAMGAIGKAIAVYPTPFWRALGLNGQAVADVGVVRSTFDNSPADGSWGGMMGFIEADVMRKYDEADESEIVREVTRDYVAMFGPQAANASAWVIQRWDNEEWSRGGPVAFAGPGVLSQYGESLRKVVGGIHWAGTESADYWVGYMDGAIRSGERAAKEVLASLKK